MARLEALNLALGFICTLLLIKYDNDTQRAILTISAIVFYSNAIRLLLQRTKNGN